MKKLYTIGRDESCDIVVSDPTDMVSRVHATLNVKGRGKYTLVDQGRNGTYVNGMRMSSSESIPVTRKDRISLAQVVDLDWNLIPKERNHLLIWIVSLVAVCAIAAVCYFVFVPSQTADVNAVEETGQTFEIQETPDRPQAPVNEENDTKTSVRNESAAPARPAPDAKARPVGDKPVIKEDNPKQEKKTELQEDKTGNKEDKTGNKEDKEDNHNNVEDPVVPLI